MGSHFRNFIKYFSIFFLVQVILLSSCTQSVPEYKNATATIIFDYSSTDSLPAARLSVFVESLSDVRRYETINVKAMENNYIWDVSEIIKFKAADKMYAGNTNIVMPSNEQFPVGEYSICYVNANLEKMESKILVNYDSAFYDKKASEVPEFMKSKFGKKNISIYDKDNKLLYYGERTDQLGDTRKIWNKTR